MPGSSSQASSTGSPITGWTNREAEQPNDTSRSLGIYSIDAGVYLDRTLDDRGSVQTLEPRLYYLRVPYKDQSILPNFDSSAFDFSIAQLFRDNRFTGADRIGDANQLSMALTSRIINGSDGREPLRASIGQILYFDERRVTLDQPGGTLPDEADSPSTESPVIGDTSVDSSDVSDIVGEVSSELVKDWFGRGNVQWNPDTSDTVRASVLLSYRPAADRIINAGASARDSRRGRAGRSRDDAFASADTEQLDLSFVWPLFEQYRLAGRWNYSIDADTSIESLFGVEYDSCCWAFRLAARRYISEDGQDHDTNVYLQLVLKGLAPLGQNYGALLENAVLGYRDDQP